MQYSGLNKVDALLKNDPSWGLWQAAGNTVYYRVNGTPSISAVSSVAALTTAQAANVDTLLAYVGSVTGIQFVRTESAVWSNVLNFCTGDIDGVYDGLCEVNNSTSYDIIVDTVTYPFLGDFAPGTKAYETLLHEIGHALGLKHPFDGSPNLPPGEDNKTNTVMSYKGPWAGHTTYSPYDLLALSWIYGGDGIGGTWGFASTNGPVLPPEAYDPIWHDLAAGLAAVPEQIGSFSFTVTRSGNLTLASTAAWAISGSVDAADFGGTLPSGIVSFAPGQTLATVIVTVSDDATLEADEAFAITLGAMTGNGARPGPAGSLALTLLDDDTPSSVAVAVAERIGEGSGGSTTLDFVVSRSGNTHKAASVTWAVAPGGQANAADFGGTLPSGSVSFAPGETERHLTLPIAADTTIEPDETFAITLTPQVFASIVGGAPTVTIVNDDFDSTLAITAARSRVDEGQAGTQSLAFTVTRSGSLAASVGVDWALDTASLGGIDLADISGATSGHLTFAAGQTSQGLAITLRGDTRIEADENLTVRLLEPSGLGLGIATGSATTVVANDDPRGLVRAVAAVPSLPEGSSANLTHVFTLTRSGDLSEAASLPWSVAGSTNALDFVGAVVPSGTASWPAGQASTTISVQTVADKLYEPDESFSLVLGAGLVVEPDPAAPAASVSLLNDDQPDELRIAVRNARTSEGSASGASASIWFDLTRLGDTNRSASVQWRCLGQATADASAADAADFVGGVLPAGSVSFAPGETKKSFYLSVASDTLAELDEAFRVELFDAQGSSVSASAGSAVATIVSDDPLPAFAVSARSASLAEGSAGGLTTVSFDITRNLASFTGSVKWEIVVGEAGGIDAADLPAGFVRSGTAHFAAGGGLTVTLGLPLLQDQAVEPAELYSLRLFDPVGAVLAPGRERAGTTIANDDSARRVTGLANDGDGLGLGGARSEYDLGYDAARDLFVLVDKAPARDGQSELVEVEYLRFADGQVVQLEPVGVQTDCLRLGRAFFGATGLDYGLYGDALDYAHAFGAPALAELGLAYALAGQSNAQVAAAIVANVGISAATMGGGSSGQQLSDAAVQTVADMLAAEPEGHRGQAILDAVTLLAGLQAHPVFGERARAFVDSIAIEWLGEFATHPATRAETPAWVAGLHPGEIHQDSVGVHPAMLVDAMGWGP